MWDSDHLLIYTMFTIAGLVFQPVGATVMMPLAIVAVCSMSRLWLIPPHGMSGFEHLLTVSHGAQGFSGVCLSANNPN